MGKLSEKSFLQPIIKNESNGEAEGYYCPNLFKLVIVWSNATQQQAHSLLMRLQTAIDRRGLHNSFEKIEIVRG